MVFKFHYIFSIPAIFLPEEALIIVLLSIVMSYGVLYLVYFRNFVIDANGVQMLRFGKPVINDRLIEFHRISELLIVRSYEGRFFSVILEGKMKIEHPTMTIDWSKEKAEQMAVKLGEFGYEVSVECY